MFPRAGAERGRETAASISARVCWRGMKPVVVAVGRHRLGNWWRVAAGSVLCAVSRQGTSHQPSTRLGRGVLWARTELGELPPSSKTCGHRRWRGGLQSSWPVFKPVLCRH